METAFYGCQRVVDKRTRVRALKGDEHNQMQEMTETAEETKKQDAIVIGRGVTLRSPADIDTSSDNEPLNRARAAFRMACHAMKECGK